MVNDKGCNHQSPVIVSHEHKILIHEHIPARIVYLIDYWSLRSPLLDLRTKLFMNSRDGRRQWANVAEVRIEIFTRYTAEYVVSYLCYV